MGFINAEMFQSLKAAGISDEDAKKGAAVLCEIDTRLIKLEAEHRITRYLVGLNILLTFIFGFGILHILH